MKKSSKYFIITGILILMLGCFGFIIWFSCRPTERAVKSAKCALLASTDNPESVKIVSVSKPDSVFGKNFITDEEKMNLTIAMMKVNEKVMSLTSNLENFDDDSPEVRELMERQVSSMSVLRGILPSTVIQQKKPKFKGWKVKINYRATSESGNTYESEYWCFIDKTGNHVITSFEIPII